MRNKTYIFNTDASCLQNVFDVNEIPCTRGVVFTIKGIHFDPRVAQQFVDLVEIKDARFKFKFAQVTVGKFEEMLEKGMISEYPEQGFQSFEELKSKVVHQSAGDVGVSTCETEYLMQGKNGERLQESVGRIRGVRMGKEKSQRISKNTMESYLAQYGVKTLEQRYNEWILENIHVYDLFCKFTLQAIQSGRKKISHWLIVNRLRWEVEIETKGLCEEDKEYKISNDYIAFLARDFIKDHPEHESIFNLKQMKRV